MNTFKSIDELLRVLEREKLLLKQMFQKRASTSLKYDYALELTEYKEEFSLIESKGIANLSSYQLKDMVEKYFIL